jgi:hypothetical protein
MMHGNMNVKFYSNIFLNLLSFTLMQNTVIPAVLLTSQPAKHVCH